MVHYSAKILEEELKNKVREDWFGGFDGTSIHGKIDFSIAMKATALVLGEPESLYWAEAKAGTSHDIYDSITQLVLTIGKARAPEKFLPPKYLGAFDAEKIAFLEYWRVADVFTQTDFNWNVTPSDHSTREFHHVHDLIAGTLDQGLRVFDYDADAKELACFIRSSYTSTLRMPRQRQRAQKPEREPTRPALQRRFHSTSITSLWSVPPRMNSLHCFCFEFRRKYRVASLPSSQH